jgi:hypothetical protein
MGCGETERISTPFAAREAREYSRLPPTRVYGTIHAVTASMSVAHSTAYCISCSFFLPILPTLPKRKKYKMETTVYENAKNRTGKISSRQSSLSSQKADLRHETSAFALLVWTYADEHVRAASDGGDYGHEAKTSTLLGRLIDGVVGSGRGTINGLLEAHEDAMAVDALVWAWFDQNGSHRAYLASYLERRVAPPHPDTLERQRRVPRLRANGKPHVIYDHNRNPVGVLEDVVGYDEKQIAYASYHHRMFVELIGVLPGIHLTRWKVTRSGLTQNEESLTTLCRV